MVAFEVSSLVTSQGGLLGDGEDSSAVVVVAVVVAEPLDDMDP